MGLHILPISRHEEGRKRRGEKMGKTRVGGNSETVNIVGKRGQEEYNERETERNGERTRTKGRLVLKRAQSTHERGLIGDLGLGRKRKVNVVNYVVFYMVLCPFPYFLFNVFN